MVEASNQAAMAKDKQPLVKQVQHVLNSNSKESLMEKSGNHADS